MKALAEDVKQRGRARLTAERNADVSRDIEALFRD